MIDLIERTELILLNNSSKLFRKKFRQKQNFINKFLINFFSKSCLFFYVIFIITTIPDH